MVIVLLLFLLALNAVLAMSELALMTSRPARLEESAKEHGSARIALRLARDPSRFLSTVQVGITLVGIAAGAIGERALASDLTGWFSQWEGLRPYADEAALLIVVCTIGYCTLVLGELVPKRIALAHPEAVSLVIARPLHALSVLALPLVKVLSVSTDAVIRVLRVAPGTSDDVSEEDVHVTLAKAARSGVVEPIEHELLERVLTVGDLRVSALMVPRSEIEWIDSELSTGDVRVLVAMNPYSHFPVCRGSLDNLIGVVHIKDLISHGLVAGTEFKVASVAQKPLYVPETMPALSLLEAFQAAHVHIAFVVDEHGSIEGLITLNDLMKPLLGHISREEEEPGAVAREDGSWLLDGLMPLHDVVQTLNLPGSMLEQAADVNTIGGLVVRLLGHVPKRGESVDWGPWRLEVLDMDRQRVDQVLARRLRPEEPPIKSPR